MNRRLRKEFFRHPDGSTVADHLNDFLRDHKDVLYLSAFTLEVSRNGQLLGRAMRRFQLDGFEVYLYRLDDGVFRLYYSYFQARLEVCFLMVVEGVAERWQEEAALLMIKEFYGPN
jgi:hypothetical protein